MINAGSSRTVCYTSSVSKRAVQEVTRLAAKEMGGSW